jgi:hypothetical protein
MFRVVTQVEQRVVVLAGDQNDITAIAAIAAAGAAARNEFLAPERKNTVAAVAGFDVDYYLINEHGKTAP